MIHTLIDPDSFAGVDDVLALSLLLLLAAATGGERHAHDGQRREQHLWSPHFSSSSLAAAGQRDI